MKISELITETICRDGFKMSVRASKHHYCTPRSDSGPWEEMEVGFPSVKEELLMEYANDPRKPTETVYAYVPIHTINAVIKKHGGRV